MFEQFLASIPKNRSEMVNELEIPDVTVKPYFWTDPEESLNTRSDSLIKSINEDLRTLSTDSSLALSRAMTDSEIDYGWYKRFKGRSFSDPWDVLKVSNDAFPPGYLDSLQSCRSVSSEAIENTTTRESAHQYNEELRLKMERLFEEECRPFTPDDPALLELEEALSCVDLKSLESELSDNAPRNREVVKF